MDKSDLRCFWWWALQYTYSCKLNPKLSGTLRKCLEKDCKGKDVQCCLYTLKIFPTKLRQDVVEYLKKKES